MSLSNKKEDKQIRLYNSRNFCTTKFKMARIKRHPTNGIKYLPKTHLTKGHYSRYLTTCKLKKKKPSTKWREEMNKNLSNTGIWSTSSSLTNKEIHNTRIRNHLSPMKSTYHKVQTHTVLVEIWRKWNLYPLLLRMLTGSTLL